MAQPADPRDPKSLVLHFGAKPDVPPRVLPIESLSAKFAFVMVEGTRVAFRRDNGRCVGKGGTRIRAFVPGEEPHVFEEAHRAYRDKVEAAAEAERRRAVLGRVKDREARLAAFASVREAWLSRTVLRAPFGAVHVLSVANKRQETMLFLHLSQELTPFSGLRVRVVPTYLASEPGNSERVRPGYFSSDCGYGSVPEAVGALLLDFDLVGKVEQPPASISQNWNDPPGTPLTDMPRFVPAGGAA